MARGEITHKHSCGGGAIFFAQLLAKGGGGGANALRLDARLDGGPKRLWTDLEQRHREAVTNACARAQGMVDAAPKLRAGS